VCCAAALESDCPGLVTHTQVTAALLRAAEHPSEDFRVVTAPDLKQR
jgi:hypothetical protein